MANNTEYVNRMSWGSVRVAVASRSPRNSMLISREIRNMEQCRDYRKEKKRKTFLLPECQNDAFTHSEEMLAFA